MVKITSVNTAQQLLDRGYTHITLKIYYEGGAKSSLVLYQNTNSASSPVLATLARNAWTPVKIDLQEVKAFMESNGTYNLMINNGGGSVGYKQMTLYMSSIYAITK